MNKKTIFTTQQFKINQSRYIEDGVTYSYSFPVCFYKKIPTLYATLTIDSLNASTIDIDIVTPSGDPYSHWYMRESCACKLVSDINDRIVEKVRKLTNDEYDISWSGLRELRIQRRRHLERGKGLLHKTK